MAGLMGGSMGPTGMAIPLALAPGGMVGMQAGSRPYGLNSNSDGGSTDSMAGDGVAETGSVPSGLATPEQGPPGPVMSGMHGSSSMGNLHQAMQASHLAMAGA